LTIANRGGFAFRASDNMQSNMQGRGTLRERITQQRLQDRAREMRIREREDERIAAIHEEMALIKVSGDMSFELIKSKLSALTNRINNIHEARADRELINAEREMQRTKKLLEESSSSSTERKDKNDSHKTQEEIEEKKEREAIADLSHIAATKDRISTLRQTRANLKREAGQVQRAVESENSNYVKIGVIPGLLNSDEGLVIAAGSGFANPNDFRNRHLNKLNLGIVNTTAAINHSIARLYRQSTAIQEANLKQTEDNDYNIEESQAERGDEKTNIDKEL